MSLENYAARRPYVERNPEIEITVGLIDALMSVAHAAAERIKVIPSDSMEQSVIDALDDLYSHKGLRLLLQFGGNAAFAQETERWMSVEQVEIHGLRVTVRDLQERLEAAEREREAKCPRCDSHDPSLHPAMQFEGEVQPCGDPWHKPQPREAAPDAATYADKEAARLRREAGE